MSTPATILVQATGPDTADDALTAVRSTITVYGIAHRTTGPYDVIANLAVDGPDELGRLVLAVQALEPVARTLTLPHVDEEPTR